MQSGIKNIRSLITVLNIHQDKRALGRLSFSQKSQFRIYKPFIKELGLKCKIYSTQRSNKNIHRHFLFISKKESIIKNAIKYHYITPESKNIILGKLYGYPSCCIKLFSYNQNLAIKDSDSDILLKAFENSQSNIFSVYTNWFSPHKLILHLPHSFDCVPSVKIGRQNLEMLQEYDKKLFNLAIKELNACILEYKGNIIALSNFIIEKEKIKIGLNFWTDTLSVLVNNIVFKKNSKVILSFWTDILSPFKSKGVYNIKFDNSQGIKVMIFSKDLIKNEI